VDGCRGQIFDTWPDGENRVLLADVISLLAMTMSAPTDAMPESLKYRLLGTPESLGEFGHEYVRNLAGEIGYAAPPSLPMSRPLPLQHLR
jgi:26S proteasome regulatory subunit N1